LSGDAGIGDIRAMIGRGLPPEADAWRVSKMKSPRLRARDVVHRSVDRQAVQRRPRRGQRNRRHGGPSPVREAALPPRPVLGGDGTFPNHEANPLIDENRRDIVERVVAERADIGIAWDGDADRCFFIDGSGEFIAGDFITALLAEAFLLKHPGAKIVYDVRASYAVKDVVARHGGTALMNRVGHAFFKTRMREDGAIFGGEVTGHYYFRDNFYADNGFIPALLILELMSRGVGTEQGAAPLRALFHLALSTRRSAACRP
jgi:phosphomannomutase